MYRCSHCRDLHLHADQARICSTHDGAWPDEALAEVERILQRGPIPWEAKRTMRVGLRWTLSERRMWNALQAALPDEIVHAQWWIPGCDYRVDFFVPAVSLAVEIDGSSHDDKAGSDRLRSSVLRSHGITVLRVTDDDARTASERTAWLVADRVRSELEALESLAVPA